VVSRSRNVFRSEAALPGIHTTTKELEGVAVSFVPFPNAYAPTTRSMARGIHLNFVIIFASKV
jgi:hypothetical protein